MDDNKEILKSREYRLFFEPPLFSFCIGIYTTLTHDDIVTIYRQVRSKKLKGQLKRFIQRIDEEQQIKSNMDTYKLPNINMKEPEGKRNVITYANGKRKKEIINEN